jgi:hypothetical protein
MRFTALTSPLPALAAASFRCLVAVSCGGSSAGGDVVGGFPPAPQDPSPDPAYGPPAGNPDGAYPVSLEARAEDVSFPDQVVGDGTPESCTQEAFLAAVAEGGTIVFDGGPDPFTITLTEPAKVFNDRDPDVVIDGGGLVTLSGGGTTRILCMNTCDPELHWTTFHCQNQDHPRLTVQNLTFVDGNSTNETEYDGGGAVWVRGGRFKAALPARLAGIGRAMRPTVASNAIQAVGRARPWGVIGPRTPGPRDASAGSWRIGARSGPSPPGPLSGRARPSSPHPAALRADYGKTPRST